jgi:hypothetical protein
MSTTNDAREQLRKRRLRLQRQRQSERRAKISPQSSPVRQSRSAGTKSSEKEQELIVPKIPSSLTKRTPLRRSANNSNSNDDDDYDHDDTTSHYEAKYSPARGDVVRRSWAEPVEQKSQAPSPSEVVWRTEASTKVEEEGVKEEEKAKESRGVATTTTTTTTTTTAASVAVAAELQDAIDDFPYMNGQLDDLDVSGVCDTPIQERMEEPNDDNENEEGSDTDTEHDIENSPSATKYGLRRQDLEQHRLRSEAKSNKEGGGGGVLPPHRDPLASIFELLETTDAQSIAASSAHHHLEERGNEMSSPAGTFQQHDWEDMESVVSSVAPSIAAPSLMSIASSRMTTTSGRPMSKVYDSMKARLTGLTMEVEDKSKTLTMLKKLLREARAAHRETEETLASREAEKLKKVRSEYESTIARHLSFIDRLLADKQSLSDKCDALAEEMSRVEKRYAARVLDVQEGHVKELKRQKEALAAGERARRERWTEDKRREIKETTLKGLEPELQRILAKHKTELRTMEDGHLKLLRNAELKLERERDEVLRNQRERMERERDEAVSSEMDVCRAKLREMSKKHDEEITMLRKRWESDASERSVRDETELARHAERHAAEMEKVRVAERERREDQAQRFAEDRTSLERRHEDALSDIRRRAEEERLEWRARESTKYEESQAQEVAVMREELVQERDAQIDLVIRRLDEETGRKQSEATISFTRRMEEMKKEHSRDLRALRASESAWMDKCTHATQAHDITREQLQRVETRHADAEDQRGLMAAELAESRRMVQTKVSELRREHAEARTEDVRRQESLERTVSALERRLEAASDELAMAVGEERRKRSTELDSVHSRVRQTITKKDDMIVALQEELRVSRIQTEHAADLLERQRRELLAE